ncbi:MAG: M55 family metallopeptidase [Deltaproteobacteria bacterium]|nr:M55 family metallopeptidase [Deltaproteobacteria bacterium]
MPLTEDVNAVIKGAFDGGAQKVTVKDTHELGFNCIIKNIDPRARYVGGHFIRPSLYGKEDAFFPHTHYGIFSEVRVNRNIVSEMDIYGAYLGEFGIPIGFVSGDKMAAKQALKTLPWAKSVVVDKRKETYTSGDKSLQYVLEGRQRLRETAAEAVRVINSMKPLILKGPLHFETVFRNIELANRFNTWGFKQTDKQVEWDADNMIDGFEMFNKL